MATKKTRQNRILEIIRTNNIKTQDELADFLKNEGWDVTQATVSRDIKELELIKIRSNGESVYAPSEARESELLKSSVVSVDFAMNIVVVKTLAGMAQGVANLLDNMELSGTLGSIAGDDTIMIVAVNEKTAENICLLIKQMR